MQPVGLRLGTSAAANCDAQSGDLLRLTFGYGTINNNGNVLTQAISRPSFSVTQTYGYTDPLERGQPDPSQREFLQVLMIGGTVNLKLEMQKGLKKFNLWPCSASEVKVGVGLRGCGVLMNWARSMSTSGGTRGGKPCIMCWHDAKHSKRHPNAVFTPWRIAGMLGLVES